ncbi:Ger(x)C family spore germination protein [Ferdinandcohnia sp. Marseille-Q9671]
MGKWKKTIVFLLVACMVSLVGCTRTKIVDKLSIIHVYGLDLDDKGKVTGTVLYPNYSKDESSDNIQYLQETDEAISLLTPRMATHTTTPVELAKMRVVVIGKEYAETGISDLVDRILVNPRVGTNIQLAASTHSAEETLKALKKQGELTLADQIRQNMNGQIIPYMNLHVFLNHFYGEGMDPYVPMLTLDKNNKIQVDQVGIFKKDKLKLHLTRIESFIFSVLKDAGTQGTYKIKLDESNRQEIIIVQGVHSTPNWDWVKDKQQLNLRLDFKWTITHHPTSYDLEQPDDIEKLKKIIVENVKKDIEDLLTKFKEEEVDPLGIGNIVRSQDRYWNKENFYEQYPSLPINIKINLEIIHSGLQG